MKLKSFGCSFIYGSDLKDCPPGINHNHPPPSKLTWPSLIADLYGLEHECWARPAAGNLQILETLLSQVNLLEDDLHVINWTWIDRFSFTREQAKSHSSPWGKPWNTNGWCNILPGDSDPVSKIYYKNIHSQFRDKLETLLCIKTALDILMSNDKKFLMTYTDDLMFEKQWHTSPGMLHLMAGVEPLVLHFDNSSFWHWVRKNEFAISEKWHPLEQAHSAAADHVRPIIDAILRRA